MDVEKDIMPERNNYSLLQAPLVVLTALVSALMIFVSAVSLMNSADIKLMLSDEVASWVQAIGAIIAIVSGFAIANRQSKAQQSAISDEKKALTKAAYLISYEAISTLIDRLEEVITPNRHCSKFLLQGNRTTEIIFSMKEFNASNLPAAMLPSFISLRSHLFAINEKISSVLNAEDKNSISCNAGADKKDRRNELESAVRVSARAVDIFEQLSEAHEEINGSRESLDIPINLGEYQKEVRVKDKE